MAMETGKASVAPNTFTVITTSNMLHIPPFTGEDAYIWISQVERYFDANPMNERDKFRAAVDALQEPALTWYDEWKKYTPTALTWSSLKDAVLKHFEPEAIRFPCLALINIRQEGTVKEYRQLFETLSRSEQLKSMNLSEEISMAIFLNGLREDLKEFPILHEATSLVDMMDTAQLLEEEIRAQYVADLKPRPNPKLEFWGEIAGRKVIVIVATGSSDSIIAKRIVMELGLPVCESDELFDFGFGPPLKSEGLCKGVKLKLRKDLEITRDFFVFENHERKEDIVLGSDWVYSLGSATVYYEEGLTMEFNVAGKTIILKGDPSLTAPPGEVRISYMRRLKT